MLLNKVLCGMTLVGVCGLAFDQAQGCDRVYRTVYTPQPIHTTYVQVPVSPVIVATPVVHQPVATITQVVAVQKPAPAPAVAPAVSTRAPQIRSGEKVRVPLKFAGVERGVVFLKHGGLTLEAEILEWSNNHVLFVMPRLELSENVPAQIEVLRFNGQYVKDFGVTLEPEAIHVFRESVVIPASSAAASTQTTITQ